MAQLFDLFKTIILCSVVVLLLTAIQIYNTNSGKVANKTISEPSQAAELESPLPDDSSVPVAKLVQQQERLIMENSFVVSQLENVLAKVSALEDGVHQLQSMPRPPPDLEGIYNMLQEKGTLAGIMSVVLRDRKKVIQPAKQRSKATGHHLSGPRKLRHCQVRDFSRWVPEEFECLPLDVFPRVNICLHPREEDAFIYDAIYNVGLFEAPKVRLVQHFLEMNPSYGLIDIGANIGQYSLIAANMGHRAVAVEPFVDNVKRFHKAVQLARFRNSITLVTNVVSDRRGAVKLHPKPENKGGTFVEQKDTLTVYSKDICSGTCNYIVKSILMDDLLEVIPFAQSLLKVDIEGFERVAFKNASKLFDAVYIPLVFMEWVFYTDPHYKPGYKEDVQRLVEFMEGRGYEAYADFDQRFAFPLPSNNFVWRYWPSDIIWKLSSYQADHRQAEEDKYHDNTEDGGAKVTSVEEQNEVPSEKDDTVAADSSKNMPVESKGAAQNIRPRLAQSQAAKPPSDNGAPIHRDAPLRFNPRDPAIPQHISKTNNPPSEPEVNEAGSHGNRVKRTTDAKKKVRRKRKPLPGDAR